jgi:hypothetical protein
LFIILRSLPALNCETFLSLDHNDPTVPNVVRPSDNEVAALRGFNCVRRCFVFIRSVAIHLQMYGASAPAWWLVGVSALELLLMAAGWRALGGLTRLQGRSVLALALVFLFTHGAGMGCLALPGGCSDLRWLGAVLIALNAFLLLWLVARPVRGACRVLTTPPSNTAPAAKTPVLVSSQRGFGRPYVNFCCKLAEPEPETEPETNTQAAPAGLHIRGASTP